ncbi:MAG: putative DNA-binding domain-containing protein [Pseudomonadales bacterium]|nr:putative DNA-binding domain-containing protein [Pseudomonadales bacterium]
MPHSGTNLPEFREMQLAFAAHIRNPLEYPVPAGVDARRMQVYVNLFFNSIESLLAGCFPVSKRVLGEEAWRGLVREFIHHHPSESPYFLEVSQEFLDFVQSGVPAELPDFLLELLHYEWVELALGVSDAEFPVRDVDPDGDLLAGEVVVSPLARCLAYRYPVHEIGPNNRPSAPPDRPTELIVYRRRDDSVHFMRVNALTLRLVTLLSEVTNGREALENLGREAAHLDPALTFKEGIATLERLREAQVLVGTRSPGYG